MLIKDKNEAFRHNSCKKIAQLSKVIYAMILQRQDRVDILNDLNDEFENFVLEIIDQHQNQQEKIFNQLSKFRKSTINSSCHYFGTMYKQIKIEFANFLADQNEKFQCLYNEAKFLQNDIRNFQMNFLQVAAQFLDSSDTFEKDLKLYLNNNRAKEELMKKAVWPIYQKMLNLNEEIKEKLDSMENDHQIQKNELISTFSIKLNELIRQRYQPYLLEKKAQIREIKNEISEFKSQYANIFQNHQKYTKGQLKRRNQLIDEAHQSNRTIQKQIKSISSVGNSKNNYEAQIKSLEKTRNINQQNFIKTIDQLSKEIHQLKHNRHQFTRSKSSELTTIQQKNRDVIFSKQKKYDSQNRNMADTTNYMIELIKVASNDTKRLIVLLSNLISKSIEKENSILLNFQSKNLTQISDYESILKKSQTTFDLFINDFNTLFDTKFLSFQAYLEINQNLKTELNSMKIRNSKKIQSKLQKQQNEMARYMNSCKEKEEGCKETNQNILKRKIEMNNKTINTFKVKFNEELRIKINSINQENEKQLQGIQKVDNSPIEINDQSIIKLQSKLKFWENQVNQTKSLYAKKIEAYDSEILNLDKTIRQIQRSIKTETQKIDEEYEIKIQIVQVDLEHKIENLSKLFTEEENRRATEIIESIRMINDVKNRQFDLQIKRKNDQQLNLKNKNLKLKEMKDKIDDYQNHQTENKLKAKIEELTKINNRTQFSLEKKRIEEISKINKEIEINKETINQQFLSIDNDIQREKSKFDLAKSNLEKEIIEMETSKEQKIEEIAKKYADKVENIQNEHQRYVNNLKNKIEKCKKEKLDLENKLNQEKDSLLSQLQKENRFDLYSKLQFNENHAIVDQKVSDLIRAMASYADPEKMLQMRKKDQVSMNNLNKSIKNHAKNLSLEFEKTISNMKFIFRKKYDEPKTSRVDTNQRISLASLPKNVSKSIVFDKSAPLLITPQFV